tara:strand:+ start:536 stop:2029 length:1494 start_codon:yes stop_codon:yes gene_type:complete
MTCKQFYGLKPLCICLLFFAVVQEAWSQLPDGSLAPDFSAIDLNGVTWELSELLGSGNTVVLNFGATWCNSCWGEENEDVLNTLHNAFGPEGSNDVTVLYLEFDDAFTSLEDLLGTGPNTTGNWVQSVEYPVIDSAGSIYELFGGSQEPFVCLVCPDGLVTNLPDLEFDFVRDVAFNECDNQVSGPAVNIHHFGMQSSCADSTSAFIEMTNLGNDILNSATFNFILGDDSTEVTWSGDLSIDSAVVLDMGQVDVPSSWSVMLTSLNAVPRSFGQYVDVMGSVSTATTIEVKLITDHWPQESGWRITDDLGTILEEVEVGSLGGLQETTLTWEVQLPDLGCYELVLLDAAGDGLEAEIYGNYPNGSLTISNIDAGAVTAPVVEWDGGDEGAFFEKVLGIQADEESRLIQQNSKPRLTIFPNPVVNRTTIEVPSVFGNDFDLAIYSTHGQCILRRNYRSELSQESRLSLELDHLEKGSYFVHLYSNNHMPDLTISFVKL